MKRIPLILSFAIIASLPIQSLQAQTERALTVAQTKESEFCEDVLEDNANVIAMLQLGISNGTDAGIRALAERMLVEQQSIDSTFREYVERRNVKFMGRVDTPGKKHISAKTARAWDEEWADEVADKNRKMIARFEKAQDYTRDEELKTIIVNTLPILREHRDTAIQQQKRMAAMKY